MRTGIRLFSEEERNRVHEASLDLLEDVGIEFPSQAALDTLEKAGAKVDPAGSRVRFPRGMVEEALKAAPSQVALGGFDPQWDALLDGSRCYIGTDGCGTYVRDFQTGERRPSTLDDLIEATVVSDALDCVHIYWAPIVAGNVPSNTRLLREIVEMAKYTSKHIQHELTRPQQVPFFFEIMQVLAGSKAAAIERKMGSMVWCSISPLKHDGEMTEVAMALTEYEVPVVPLPMPMAGATAPASLMGAVIINNVEVLSCLVLLQVCRPGTPVVYGAAGSVIDMKRGTFAAGAPEEGLINGACAEMARYYGLPSITTGLVTDAVEPGVQAALEKVINGTIPVLAGSDGVIGIGLLETDQCLSLEQLVVDAEMCRQILRLRDGIAAGPEMALTELIKQVGPGGHFMAEESTCRLVRQGEHYIPELFDRLPYEVWEQSGKPDMISLARERVSAVLEDPPACRLDEQQVRELDRILRKAGEVL